MGADFQGFQEFQELTLQEMIRGVTKSASSREEARERIGALLHRLGLRTLPDIAQRLAAGVHQSYNISAIAPMPSEGARIETGEGVCGNVSHVIAELRRRGRRPANISEGHLFAMTNAAALSAESSWVWCLGQLIPHPSGRENCAMVLCLDRDGNSATSIVSVSNGVLSGHRVLSLPM